MSKTSQVKQPNKPFWPRAGRILFTMVKWPVLIGMPMAVFAAVAWWSMLAALNTDVQVVPDLRGKSVDEASFMLSSRGLSLEVGERTLFSQEIAAGSIMESVPQPGDRLKRGRSVKVYLSAGIKTRLVPNLIDKSVVAAQMLGKQQGFTVKSAQSAYSETVPVGHVISQDPEPNTAFISQMVEILVSKGAHPRLVTMPQCSGRPLLPVLQELRSLRLPVVVRRRGETADISSREDFELRQYSIYRQYPEAGRFINLDNPGVVILRVDWSSYQ